VVSRFPWKYRACIVLRRLVVDLGMRLCAAILLQAPFVGVSDPILGRSCDIEGLARKVSSRSGFLEVRDTRATEKMTVFIKKCFESSEDVREAPKQVFVEEGFESNKYVRERSKAVLDTYFLAGR
jgi:hypothetical protein